MTLLPKREDDALLRGLACFVDDIALNNPLFVAFVRGQFAGAQVIKVDPTDAETSAGVVAVHTAADVAHLGDLAVNELMPLQHELRFPVLAQITACAGQPVAAVLADSPANALDGADQVLVEETETGHTPTRIAEKSWQQGTMGNASAHTVTTQIQHPRLAPNPMEPRSIAIAYNRDNDHVTIWQSTQTPHRTRSELARILGIDPARLRVIARHVGGAFGMKASLYPEEVFAVWAAIHHKRDVKWIATRSEDFLSATHGRGLTTNGSLSLDEQGNFQSLNAQISAPIGPWLPNSALVPALNAGRILPSGYRVAAVDIETSAVTQARGPIGIYRGAGRPEANMLMERLIDLAARKTGRDPLDLRRHNLLKQNDLPHLTATGELLDSGDYLQALDRIAPHYGQALAKRDTARATGELSGVGLAFYLEPSGIGWESATVTRTDTGAHVASGSSSQGHARETAYARIAADALGLSPDQITVDLGDTETCPDGIGAVASRSTAIGGSAVLEACEKINAKLEQGHALPITADSRYENKGMAWGYGVYLTQVSIDQDTGTLTIQRITCVDDTGRMICPDLVTGQIVGGIAQGLGEAVMEHVEYDEDGQLLTGSLMDYAVPRATDMPPIELHSFETPSPMNLLGAKGVGEAGTIGAPAAILNAAMDALAPRGVTELQMPLTPCRIWHALQAAKDPAA